MKVCEKIIDSRPHIDLQSNYDKDKFLTHLKNTLQFFIAFNGNHSDLYENFNKNNTHHLIFQIILKCIKGQELDQIEINMLIALSKSIRFDTEHDFGTGASGTRDNCKNDLVQKCEIGRAHV